MLTSSLISSPIDDYVSDRGVGLDTFQMNLDATFEIQIK